MLIQAVADTDGLPIEQVEPDLRVQISEIIETHQELTIELRRFDNESDDALKPYIQAFASAYCYAPNTGKTVDVALGKVVAVLCFRAAQATAANA